MIEPQSMHDGASACVAKATLMPPRFSEGKPFDEPLACPFECPLACPFEAPTVAELSERLGLSPDLVIEGLESANAYNTLSLDAPDQNEADATRGGQPQEPSKQAVIEPPSKHS